MKKLVLVLLCILYSVQSVNAQIEDFVSRYTEANGRGFMQPLADAFTANLNSGWYRTARSKKLGVQVYVGLSTFAAVIPDNKKTFTAVVDQEFAQFSDQIDENGNFSGAPTLFGSTEAVTIQGAGGTEYSFPGGLGVDVLPFAVPQLSIGSVFHTDVSFRYVPTINAGEDVGDVDLFGFGIRHGIGQYIPLFPDKIDLALAYYRTSFTVGEIVEANASMITVQGSFTVPFITAYGGLSYEMGDMSIGYTFSEGEADEEEIRFDLDPGNNIRLTLGAALRLGPFRLNGEYNISDQPVASIGIGFAFGEK